MKLLFLPLSLLFILASCSKNNGNETQLSDEFINGELAEVAKARGLKKEDLLASVKTYNPSGAQDEFLAFFGTGVSGRLAVVGMPSMKILKYVAVFSAEPWQGYAFDDESKSIIKGSAREEIEYAFGDIGTPALSLTNGAHDGRSIFMADAANGRLGLVDLAEYEAKQIVTHPYFRNSNSDVSVDGNTNYIAQTTSIPEFLESENKLLAGATFWRFIEKTSGEHKHYFIDPATSFTILLPEATQSAGVMIKRAGEDLMLSISHEGTPQLNVINWKMAQNVLGTKARKINNHLSFPLEVAIKENILKRYDLPVGSDKIIVSGDGKSALITNRHASVIQLVDMDALKTQKLVLGPIDVAGPAVDGVFSKNTLYVSVSNPNQVVAIDPEAKVVKSIHKLDFPAGKIMLPESDTNKSENRYAIVSNLAPMGRFTSVGPQTGLSAHLLDLREGKIQGLYDASIPQSTRLGAVAMSTKMNKPIFRYKIGTDPRSGLISNYKTSSGKEKVIRHGKRVHVYATVIRSHITPDLIEVEQGDIVSIHITSNEQSRDQTHGFTIDTYNVHGSWEPGKAATVTFVADRAGVFPYYCTEFCSALHLEMQGYLLVKPSKNSSVAQNDELMKLHNNNELKNFFKYIKGE